MSNPAYPDDCPEPEFDPILRTGNCESISHDQKIDWQKWLLEKEQAARKGREYFADIEDGYILQLYDAEIKLIDELKSFISSLPVK